MRLIERAPAKVNLFLHVGAARADGRHPLSSLVVFADVADALEAEPADRFELFVEGAFADAAGPTADNLVTRALALAGAPPMRVWLTKRLPAAAGLGGGSSDAGAALRLAGRLFPQIGVARLEAAARRLGADGPMCLAAQTCLAEGEGERLSPAPVFPALPAILVNPGLSSPTGAVYRAYDDDPGKASAHRPSMPDALTSIGAMAAFLAEQRNDLEGPAVHLTPGIAVALDAVRRCDGALLTRMSGSGSTVFGLFETPAAAEAAAAGLSAERPSWWVRACYLNAA